MTVDVELHNVRGCARCGGEHPELPFKKFERPVFIDDMEITLWAMCPVTEEPILMAIVFKETPHADTGD